MLCYSVACIQAINLQFEEFCGVYHANGATGFAQLKLDFGLSSGLALKGTSTWNESAKWIPEKAQSRKGNFSEAFLGKAAS